jgi:predicted histone-like DNA-binding protein
MAIKYKVIERGQPGVVGGGVKKYYAIPVMDGEMNMAEITRSIEKLCTVTGADILAVLYALVDVAIENLSNGTILRLGELGSLRMSISSSGEPKVEDVRASSIKGSSVIFTPGTRIKDMIAAAKYQKN